jgi:hypothetical protein
MDPSRSFDIHHQRREGYTIAIKMKVRPVIAKACCLDPDKLRTAEVEFCQLEVAGFIRRSNSPWSSPLHSAHGLQERRVVAFMR